MNSGTGDCNVHLFVQNNFIKFQPELGRGSTPCEYVRSAMSGTEQVQDLLPPHLTTPPPPETLRRVPGLVEGSYFVCRLH